MTQPVGKCRIIMLRWFFILAVTLLVGACTSSADTRYGLAPLPPDSTHLPLLHTNQQQEITHIKIAAESNDNGFIQGYELSLGKKERLPANCSLRDRFDRGTLLAYEFEDGQSRLGFDIDGIGIDSMEIEQIRMEFTYKFHPGKTRKERCRYKSSYQGLLGSSYNELFIRDRDTIWHEMDDRGIDWWH